MKALHTPIIIVYCNLHCHGRFVGQKNKEEEDGDGQYCLNACLALSVACLSEEEIDIILIH
jgi:hypothetical protein